jgi:septal ring factor EnvC (AmiA/AmiB activator)
MEWVLKFQKNILRYIFISLNSILFISFVSGQTIDNLQLQKEKIKSDIELASKLLEQTKIEKSTLNENLNLIINKIENRQKLISNYNSQKNIIELSISKADSSINLLVNDINNYKSEYCKLLYELYKRRNVYNALTYILSSVSFEQAFQRFRMMQEMNEYRKNQVVVLNQMNELLMIEKLNMLHLKEKLDQSINSIEQESDHLNKEKKVKEKYITSLKGKEKQLLTEINSKRKSEEIIESKIIEILNAISKDKSISYNVKGFEQNKGKLQWPVTGAIVVSSFGEHDHPIIKGLKVKNNGIDLKISNSVIVKSVYEGEVSRIVGIPGYNKAVILRHGQFLTVYANLIDVNVKLNQKITSGDTVGNIYTGEGENSGVLHFEIRNENQKLDPQQWLK